MVKESFTPTVPAGPPKEATGDEIDLDGELAPGDRAGEYLILGTIASGGCGTVYTAEHRVLGRKAAVKVLHSQLATSPEMVERFVREARVVNRIRHPNIVDIYEFGELDDKRPYFVMERSEEHTSELQSRRDLVCRLLLEKKKKNEFTQHYMM